jgi:hypothetical protein
MHPASGVSTTAQTPLLAAGPGLIVEMYVQCKDPIAQYCNTHMHSPGSLAQASRQVCRVW